MQETLLNNCDVSEFDSLVGYTVEEIITCCDSLAEGFWIKAYREVSGVKIYREYSREEGEYYVSTEYIPYTEKEKIAKEVRRDL